MRDSYRTVANGRRTHVTVANAMAMAPRPGDRKNSSVRTDLEFLLDLRFYLQASDATATAAESFRYAKSHLIRIKDTLGAHLRTMPPTPQPAVRKDHWAKIPVPIRDYVVACV